MKHVVVTQKTYQVYMAVLSVCTTDVRQNFRIGSTDLALPSLQSRCRMPLSFKP